jgi:hypothetical protein
MLDNKESERRAIPHTHDLSEVNDALAAGNELLFVWCDERPDIGRIECDAGILWDLAEKEPEESLGLGPDRSGEFIFFLIEMLDEDEDGNPIKSVSPRREETGQRCPWTESDPNEAGLTPPSGPY